LSARNALKMRVAGQHPGDLDELTPADAELRHRRFERQVAEADLFQRRPGAIAKILATMKQRHLAIAEPDVVEHR